VVLPVLENMEFVGLASKLRNIFGDIEIFGLQFSGRKKLL
jgi:hypothetical protein